MKRSTTWILVLMGCGAVGVALWLLVSEGQRENRADREDYAARVAADPGAKHPRLLSGGLEQLKVWHDEVRGVTCWVSTGDGMACLPDATFITKER